MNIEQKLQIAHEYCLRFEDQSVENAWKYADKMEAEMKKRLDHSCPIDDFDIDWCVSPSWARYWAVDSGGSTYWYSREPYIEDDSWFADNCRCNSAPAFNYKGDWKESLRVKP